MPENIAHLPEILEKTIDRHSTDTDFLKTMMRDKSKIEWRKELKDRLAKVERLVVLGIGAEESGDDGAGNACAREIKGRLKHKESEKLYVIPAGQFPEYYTGTIRKYNPTHVVIIDGAHADFPPGSVFLIEPENIQEGEPTTHRMPLSVLIRYIKETVRCEVALLGIQPAIFEEPFKLSEPVEKSIKQIADFFADLYL